MFKFGKWGYGKRWWGWNGKEGVERHRVENNVWIQIQLLDINLLKENNND